MPTQPKRKVESKARMAKKTNLDPHTHTHTHFRTCKKALSAQAIIINTCLICFCPLPTMRTAFDDVLHKRLNVSAAWSTDPSSIHSPAPRTAADATRAERMPNSHPSRSFLQHQSTDDVDAVKHRPSKPEAARGARTSTVPYPHLVRSHSPQGLFSSTAETSKQTTATSQVSPESTVLHQGEKDAASRAEDTFAEVLAREWAFQARSSDTQDFTAAVRFGQESALMHYANDGFRNLSARLAQEAGAVSMEADRYRLAAQHSSSRCRDAMAAYNGTKAEVVEAQRQLQVLLAAKEREEKNRDDTQNESVANAPTAAEPSVAALTLQLDQELTTMRAQKQRYEALCHQKARLEAQLDDWSAKEKKLVAKLERAQVRRGQELETALHDRQAKPGLSASFASGCRPADGAAKWLRDLEVCMTERTELLRHLQDGSAKRFEQFKELLNRTQDHRWSSSNRTAETPVRETPKSVSTACSSHQGDAASTQTAQKAFTGDEASLELLDYLSKVHRTVSLGEEEALTEMEHLRVLLQRLLRQEGDDTFPRQGVFHHETDYRSDGKGSSKCVNAMT